MRLTLRTMLAYLDDILEPVDAKELAQKIKESKTASDLIHRIRNSTRRLRLRAPELHGDGMGLDPNSVAEYLDNTLPSEQVPDFEKVCLDPNSDVHLAEVASCHQVLTIVLGEPAEIEPAVRERMYRIGLTGEDPQAAASRPDPLADNGAAIAGDGHAGAAARDGAATAPRPASRMPLKSLAITVALAFLLAFVGLRAMGPFDQSHPLWRLTGNAEPVAQAPGAVPPGEMSENVAPAEPAADTAPAVEPATDIETPPIPAAPPEPVPPTAETRETTEVPEAAPAAPATSETPAPSAPPEEPSADPSVAEAPSAPAEAPAAEADRAPSVVAVGRYLSEQQVLARYDKEDDSWFPLDPNTPLAEGDMVTGLPTFRPVVVLTAGMKLTLVGATQVRMQGTDESNRPRLHVDWGRMLLVPMGEENNAIAIHFGDRAGTLAFADIHSAAGLAVRRYLPPGTDPATASPQLVAQLFATSGQIAWQEGTNEPIILDPSQNLVLLGESAPEIRPAGPAPAWVAGNELKSIWRRASRELKGYLTPGRRVRLSLLEQTNIEVQRKVEMRALSCGALAHFDLFDPILKALDEEHQRAYWDDHFATLRSVATRDARSAALLRDTIQNLFDDDAAAIYRLVWGYSPAELSGGSAVELVNYLEHPRMAVRVLAFLNLEDITGKTHLFWPWEPAGQQRDKVVRWRQTLKEGGIAYKAPPSPLPPPPPLPAEAAEAAPEAPTP